MADPEIGRLVAEDEAQFLDHSSIITFLADERQTSADQLRSGNKRVQV